MLEIGPNLLCAFIAATVAYCIIATVRSVSDAYRTATYRQWDIERERTRQAEEVTKQVAIAHGNSGVPRDCSCLSTYQTAALTPTVVAST